MRARALGGLTLAAVLLGAGPAHAANTVLQGMATVSGGYNTNPTGQPGARADWFDDIRPGLRLTSLFGRGMAYAQYTFDAITYLHRAGTGFSNDLTLGTLLETSRTTTLTLTAGVTQSQFNNAATLAAPGSAPIQLVPAGAQPFVTAHASENLRWDVSPVWTLSETASFTALVALADTARPTYDLHALLEGGRRWVRDSLVLQLRLEWIDYPSTTPGGEMIGPQDQLLPGTSVRWLHDFGSFWSTEAMLGVLFALRAVETPGLLVEPLARAAVHYRRQEGSVSLSWDHSAEPSLQAGFTLIGDTLALRGAVPFGRGTDLTLAASVAYQHANMLDFRAADRVSGGIDAVLADVGLTWAPWREMSFFARYAFTDQVAESTGAFALPTFQRHLVMVGINVIYPAEAAAPVGFRSTVRVDRADAPTLPELHAPPVPAQPAR